MPCRKCDSLEAQLAQLRDMAKQNSVQPPSEQVRAFAPKKFDTILSLFDRQEMVFLRRLMKWVHFLGGIFFGVCCLTFTLGDSIPVVACG